MKNGEGGFTLIEVLVTMFILGIVTTAMYQALFAGAKGSQKARDVVGVSQEARLGFNRMVRDTRESARIVDPSVDANGEEFTINVDFNSDGVFSPAPSNPTGDYEVLTFRFNRSSSGNGTITVSNGVLTEPLMTGVDCVRKADGTCNPVFTYSSSRLEYDTNGDGISSAVPELDQAPTIGNKNGQLDGQEVLFVDVVSFSLRLSIKNSGETFFAQAQLRNQR
jgi:prepilin-type N-terminal cleavage/methylation domain-containing protein